MQQRKDDGKPAQKKANQPKMVAPAPKMATAASAKMMAAKMATAASAKMMAAKMATAAPAKMMAAKMMAAKMMAAKMASAAPAKMMAAKTASAPATHGPSSYAPIEVTPPPPYGSFSSLTEERYATGDRTSVNVDNSQRNVSNVMNGGGDGGGQGDMLNAVLLALLVKKREAAAAGPEIAPGLAMFNAPVTADNFPSIQKDIADAQALLATPSPVPAPMFDLPQASPAPAESGWGAKRVVALSLVAASVAASGRFVSTGRERLSLFFAALALASAFVL